LGVKSKFKGVTVAKKLESGYPQPSAAREM
jgi:hypothetical protein